MGHLARFVLKCCAFTAMVAMPARVPAQLAGADSTVVPGDSARASAVESSRTATVNGAPLTGLRAGAYASSRTSEPAAGSAPLQAGAHANLGTARAMMVVGLAALIVGGIVQGTPGTLIMVGGALIGLKGLYDYLQ